MPIKVKFSCLHCQQHIQAEVGYAGMQISLPGLLRRPRCPWDAGRGGAATGDSAGSYVSACPLGCGWLSVLRCGIAARRRALHRVRL